MKPIACLIPTYGRTKKLSKVIQNFKKNSRLATLYFVIVPSDKKSRKVLERLGQNYFVVDLEYTQSINYAVKRTKEPFILCAADDVIFKKGWDTKLLMLTLDKTKHIFGGIDEWDISKTMLHISHPLVRRSYVEKQEDGNLYFREYVHYMNDIELLQRGLKENCVSIIPEILLRHPHPYNQGKPQDTWDKTYQRSMSVRQRDNDIYDRRCWEFWQYDHNFLSRGMAVPTKLNPLYNKTLVSIVIPSWNDIDFLKQVLQSIADTTYYRYEIIIIDDCSDKIQSPKNSWELFNTKEFLDSIALKDQSCSIRIIYNKKHEWVNYGWNLGAKEAKGNYIAFLNTDIILSPDWDKFLVAGLESPLCKATIACPYETNPKMPKPFPLHQYFVKYCPNMIKGNCFLLRKSDVSKLFPIPSFIKHWCGDNVISDRAEKMNGVVFVEEATIHHYVTQSGKRMKKSIYINRITKDVLAYQKYSGRNMKYVLKTLKYQPAKSS